MARVRVERQRDPPLRARRHPHSPLPCVGLQTTPHTELPIDAPNVRLDRVLGYVQLSTDLADRQSCSELTKDLPLPRCELTLAPRGPSRQWPPVLDGID